eukprot:2967133-Pyramimonas_sp.AAC.1
MERGIVHSIQLCDTRHGRGRSHQREHGLRYALTGHGRNAILQARLKTSYPVPGWPGNTV